MNGFSKSREVIDMSKPYGIRKPQRRLIPPEEERSHESSSGISDDLRYGQIVIVAARWMLVLSAFVLLLYRSDKINELVFGVVGLLGIAVANFWLHTKILRKQCVEPEWVYLASAADIAVISLMTWLQGGIWGRVFPYYYPAVLCYALVFQSGIDVFHGHSRGRLRRAGRDEQSSDASGRRPGADGTPARHRWSCVRCRPIPAGRRRPAGAHPKRAACLTPGDRRERNADNV